MQKACKPSSHEWILSQRAFIYAKSSLISSESS
uniref:Uncharacterized protein n=1 Tax=Setaria italica TaxID=4555 RepID=K3Z2N7_SETIT